MAGTGLKGLQGLKGIAALSKADYHNFIENNRDVIARHGYDPSYIVGLYRNKQFIDKYGEKAFNAIPHAKLRNEMFKSDIINEEFGKRFNPKFNKYGMSDSEFSKASQLSDNAKLKLMESGYVTNAQFESNWKKNQDRYDKTQQNIDNNWLSALTRTTVHAGGVMNTKAWNTGKDVYDEASKKMLQSQNQKLFDKIYNDEADIQANQYSGQVAKAYYQYYGMSDDAIRKLFIKEITPGSYTNKNGMFNLGISNYAKYYGDGKSVFSEMSGFSIDEMREVLAKKKVYEANMPYDMAKTVLENEAMRYVKKHQGKLKRAWLFGKDVAISSLSYTADKANGVAEIGRMIEDGLAKEGAIAKPVVWMDDTGSIIDLKKTKTFKNSNGATMYKGEDGKNHYLHQTQVDYSTLHQLGKNADGSDIEGALGSDWLTLNPQYWSRAEQFGTLDKDLQKQYEKLGTSPYKVAYNPNEDSDLWYESFKMMSFGIADNLSTLVPFGIGALGRGISGLNKFGKAAQYIGKALDKTGTLLTATKPAQYIQGLVGAGGIAYAYGRGAFQETLAENLANTEEDMMDKVKHDVFDRYQSDKKYRASIDALVNAEAVKMKKEYLAQMKKDGGAQVFDINAVDKMIRAKAQDAVMATQVESQIESAKASGEYAKLQEKAIQKAGQTAFNSYLPEAIKYGLVNTLGPRKWLYQNPSGVTRKVSSSLKGLKEITTKDGLKRLATDPSKFKTLGQKAKELGKTAVSQGWSGAWTNGSDDMMVDAAERINQDSFARYLDAYKNGEALTSTYGFLDGMFSYMKGLQNSLGQESTWDATKVGLTGGLVNIAPNFTNIASLMTKKGRADYKAQFWKKPIIDEETNLPKRDAQGNIQYEQYTKKGKDGKEVSTDIKKRRNLMGQLNFFVQNGVLNTYYGKKATERDLQEHAAYVNKLLDDYDDFKSIEGLVASNMATDDYNNPGDAKTMKFLNAVQAMRVLNDLAKKSSDPTSISSIVQNAKNMIDLASRANAEGKNALSEEETKNLLSQYYAANKNIPQSEETAKEALEVIAKNAEMMKDAAKSLDNAEVQLQKAEKNLGQSIDPAVRSRYLINSALNNHWQGRLDSMKSDLDDNSSNESTTDASVAIAAIGGRKNAVELIKVYDRQEKELTDECTRDKEKVAKLESDYKEALDKVKNTKEGSKEREEAEQKAEGLNAEYQSAQQEVRYKEDLIAQTKDKRSILSGNMSSENTESNVFKLSVASEELSRYQSHLDSLKEKRKKYFKKDGNLKKGYTDAEGNLKQKFADEMAELDKQIDAYEKNVASITKQVNQYKERVLTAEEIFNLDPVTRARMMRTENRGLYSKEQQSEIEKLEKQLVDKDIDALQKIQDIALLSQRIATNKDANWRMVQNPEAAAFAVEEENERAAHTASRLMVQRAAEDIGNFLQEFDHSTKVYANISADDKNKFIYKQLRQYNPVILQEIEDQGLLPQYTKQLSDAKEWSKVVNDIEAIVSNSNKSDEEKQNIKDNISNIVENCSSREEIMTALDKVIDDVENPNAKEDFDFILKGMEKLGYQRDATIIEDRRKRKEREEAEAKQKEEERKKLEEEIAEASENAIEAAAQQAEAEDAQGKEGQESSDAENAFKQQEAEDAQADHSVPADGKGVDSINTDDIVDQTITEDDIKDKMLPGTWAADILMEDNSEEGDSKDSSINLGQIWRTGDYPHKGTLTVERKNNTIVVTTDDEVTSIPVSKDQYEETSETKKPEDSASDTFNVSSLEKKDDGWYLNGKFEGSEETTQVKAKKDFSLDSAIENLKATREADAIAKGTDTGNKNLIVEEDVVSGKSESVDEQVEEMAADKNVEEHNAEEGKELDKENENIEKNSDNTVTVLSGTAMPNWEQEPLKHEKRLVRKVDKKNNPNSTRSTFNAWMDAAGIKLQNIVDHELYKILKNNPHLKVKFMSVNPVRNATNDIDMQTHLMLVVDYDNSINKGITGIHNGENGGVIESNGKKYLIIGTVGYGKQNAAKLVYYDILWSNSQKSPNGVGLLKRGRFKFFQEHPNERFYVNEDISTEIVPLSLIPGYIVKQGEGDTETGAMSIKELLADKEHRGTNPHNVTYDNVAWGIQEARKFALVGATDSEVMFPRDKEGNQGRAFALMRASNGKYVPAYLRALKYNEMREGKLKEKIDSLLDELCYYNDVNVSEASKRRTAAIIELSKILYLNKDKDNILSRQTRNEISLQKDGVIIGIFTLDSNFDRAEFIKKFSAMNPRINVTLRVLKNKSLRDEYEEAGALDTDIKLFGTAGSTYSIYAIDADGKMVMPEHPINTAPKVGGNSDFRDVDRSQVIYKGNYYEVTKDGKFYLNSVPVSDAATLKDLQYNKRVLDSEVEVATKDGIWNYFILETGEHPEVIKINSNTKEVKVIDEEQGKQLIEKLSKEAQEKAKLEGAKAAIKEAEENGTLGLTNVDLPIDDTSSTDEDFEVDPTTGELIQKKNGTETPEGIDASDNSEESNNTQPATDANKSFASNIIPGTGNQKSTQKFSDIYNNKSYKIQVLQLVKGKWKDAPVKLEELEEFLKKKDIKVEGIGTSDKDVESYLDTIKNCRD